MKAVIMAGGRGTRLASITREELPKPMVPLCGKPVLEHQINLLRRYGAEELVIITGFLHEKIQNYFGGGENFGIPINYIVEEKPLGTGGALRFLRDKIKQDFLLIFGDLLLDISIPRMLRAHKTHGAAVTLFAHPNSHPQDSDILITDKEHWVTGYYAKKEPRGNFYPNLVNAGVYMINPSLLSSLPDQERIDLERDLIFPLSEKKHTVLAYRSPEYVRDIGTPKRLRDAEADMRAGIAGEKNLDKPQRCIFFDRDGTLNKYRDLIWLPEQLELEEGAGKALRAVNGSAYLAILVTNQPVVARGLCAEAGLDAVHHKLETLLAREGAYLDDIVYCPHHPDGGYPGEDPAYKIPCRCRKPATGMIEDSAKRFNIDLSRSFIIGDTSTDIQTGRNAGLGCVLVKTGQAGLDKKYKVKPDWIRENVEEGVKTILGLPCPPHGNPSK